MKKNRLKGQFFTLLSAISTVALVVPLAAFKAKNVKIIANGSKLTLRRAVKTNQEKAAIEADARQTPGITDVDNQSK